MFEPSAKEPKIRGVHSSFPFFVRMAYAWLLVAAALGLAATRWDTSGGIWGASRHALTVGFISVMILSVGQRILPAFAGMRMLWSTKLMLAGLVLVTTGCALRVTCEVIAYQGYANWAWSFLPVSALSELAGLTIYAINILGTFILQPSHAQKAVGNPGHAIEYFLSCNQYPCRRFDDLPFVGTEPEKYPEAPSDECVS